tara:strand:+ start:230 stop:547 length:318 start_codon:yes stop_codon:yes gene_type:complete
MLTRTEKTTYLKMNGWWSHYHMDCWFDGSLDKLSVDGDGLIIGFRPEDEGLTLEEAYSQQWKKMNQSYTNEDTSRGDEDWVDGEDRGDDDNSSYGEEYNDGEWDY